MTISVGGWRAWANNAETPDDAVATTALSVAQSSIAGMLARTIVAAHASATSTRVYRGAPGDLLSIHDAAAVTSVTDNGTLLTLGTDYQLEPLNGLSDGGEYTPYTHVRRIGGGSWTVEGRKATVSVVGRWGWTTVPGRYEEAVYVLTSDLVDSPNIRNGLVALDSAFGAVRLRENPRVMMLLTKLARAESIGLA